MKNLFILLCATLLSPLSALADDAAPAAAAPTVDDRAARDAGLEDRQVLPRVSWMLNGYPLPLVSEGIGLAAQVALFDHVALWLGHEREGSSSGGVLNFGIGKDQHVISDNEFAGLRFYARKNSGFYVGTGYKYTHAELTYDPGIFAGVNATNKFNNSGIYGGLGYRIKLNSFLVSWLIDLGVNYEPGEVQGVKYVADHLDAFGDADVAHVEMKPGYGIFPEARFGITF